MRWEAEHRPLATRIWVRNCCHPKQFGWAIFAVQDERGAPCWMIWEGSRAQGVKADVYVVGKDALPRAGDITSLRHDMHCNALLATEYAQMVLSWMILWGKSSSTTSRMRSRAASASTMTPTVSIWHGCSWLAGRQSTMLQTNNALDLYDAFHPQTCEICDGSLERA